MDVILVGLADVKSVSSGIRVFEILPIANAFRDLNHYIKNVWEGLSIMVYPDDRQKWVNFRGCFAGIRSHLILVNLTRYSVLFFTTITEIKCYPCSTACCLKFSSWAVYHYHSIGLRLWTFTNICKAYNLWPIRRVNNIYTDYECNWIDYFR